MNSKRFRIKLVNYNYNDYETGSMTGIREHLKWESLKKKRRDSRLIWSYKGLNGKAIMPTDDLIPLVRRCKNHHSLAFQVPIARLESLPGSLISSAEGEDGVANSTSLVRARG